MAALSNSGTNPVSANTSVVVVDDVCITFKINIKSKQEKTGPIWVFQEGNARYRGC